MSTGSAGSLWSRFQHDPRDPAYAGMRASDRDRAVVHDALAEAYAEGRLDRDELDERTTQVDGAKTYAELMPPIRDLTSDAVLATFAPLATGDVRRAAEQHYRDKLRDAFFGLLIPNLICWAIWYMTGHDGLIWPVFVTIPTLINFLQVASNKQRTIDARVEKLQRREADALKPPRKKPRRGNPARSPARSPAMSPARSSRSARRSPKRPDLLPAALSQDRLPRRGAVLTRRYRRGLRRPIPRGGASSATPRPPAGRTPRPPRGARRRGCR